MFDDQERCWFSLTADGRPAAYQRKPYGAVFVMLGFLEYAKASGDASYREQALTLFRRIGRYLQEPALLGRPILPGAPRLSGLADIYVLCAMALDLLEDDPRNGEYLDVLRACLRQIKLHYHPGRQLFYENAPLDQESAQTPDGRLICPGSIFEINWLLSRALDYVPDAEVSSLLLSTLEGGLEFGWDKQYGGIYYFLDVEGHSTLQLEWAMKLWWVHVEALYALVNAHARTQDRQVARLAFTSAGVGLRPLPRQAIRRMVRIPGQARRAGVEPQGRKLQRLLPYSESAAFQSANHPTEWPTLGAGASPLGQSAGAGAKSPENEGKPSISSSPSRCPTRISVL